MKTLFHASLMLPAICLLLARSTLADPPAQRSGIIGNVQQMAPSQAQPQFHRGTLMPGVQQMYPQQSQPQPQGGSLGFGTGKMYGPQSQGMFERGQTVPNLGKMLPGATQPMYERGQTVPNLKKMIESATHPSSPGPGGPGKPGDPSGPDGKGKPGKPKPPHHPDHPHWPHHPHPTYPTYPVYPVYPVYPTTPVVPSIPSVSSSWDYAPNLIISDIPTTASSQAPLAPSQPLVVLNPESNGITLRFMVNNQVVEMPPGKLLELPGDRSWEIAFDRGGSYGTARYSMQSGIHTFTRTAQGWELYRSNSMEEAQTAPASTVPSNPIP